MIRQKFAPKHQRLIRQCYPGGRGVDKRPNASELSYLLYYVSTRRAKLAKVGAYLERTISSDVNHGRTGNVQVTLLIVKGLIEKCPEDMNLIAYNVVNILTAVINSKDLNLCQNSVKLFNVFCSAHDESLFSGDPEYISLFHGLVTKYVGLAETSSGPNTLQWYQVAVDAAKALSGSRILRTPGGMREISAIMPLLLSTLYKDDDGTQLLNISREIDKSRPSEDGSRSPGPVDELSTAPSSVPGSVKKQGTDLSAVFASINEENLTVSAFMALKSLLDHPGGIEIRKSVRCMLDYMLEHKLSSQWSIVLVEIGAKWTPVQLRFYIVSALVDKLIGMKVDDLKKQLVVCRLISSLLSSSINMIGLSILDVLKVLLSHQHRIIKHNHQNAQQYDSSSIKQLIVALGDCIASLVTHIYYADQLCNIVDEILSRCLLPGGGSSADDNSNTNNNISAHTPDSQDVTLKTGDNPALKSLSVINSIPKLEAEIITNDLELVRKVLLVARTSLGKPELNPVTLSEWEGMPVLLTSEYETVRIAFAACFVEYLHNDLSAINRSSPSSTKPPANSTITTGGADDDILSSLVYGATVASVQSASHPNALVAFYHLLVEISQAVPVQGLSLVSSYMVSLYKFALDSSNIGGSGENQTNNSASLPSMALAVLKNVGLQNKLESFTGQIDGYIDQLKSAGIWCDWFEVPLSTDFDEDTKKSLEPVTLKSLESLPTLDQAKLAETIPDSGYISKLKDSLFSAPSLVLDTSAILRSPNLFSLTTPSINSTPTVDSEFHVQKTRSLTQLRINNQINGSNHSGVFFASSDMGSRSPVSMATRSQWSPKVSELKLAVSGVPTNKGLGTGSIRSTLSISTSFMSEKNTSNGQALNDENQINLSRFLSTLSLKSSNERGKVIDN